MPLSRSAKCAATIGFALTVSTLAQSASLPEYISVNTAGLSGSAGAVDLSFNPGLIPGTQSALASVTQFTGATMDPAHGAIATGDAMGTLPTTLQFDNAKQLNDAFTPVIFGSSFSFVLTVSGPAVDSPDPSASYGSDFVLALTSTDGAAALLTSDGILATVSLSPGSGTPAVQTFTSDVTVSTAAPGSSAVPEPPAGLLVAVFLGACAAFESFRKQRSRFTAL